MAGCQASCSRRRLSKAVDGGLVLERQADIVEAVQQAMLAEGIHLEADFGAIRTDDDLLLKVDADARIGAKGGIAPSAARRFPAAGRSAGCRS